MNNEAVSIDITVNSNVSAEAGQAESALKKLAQKSIATKKEVNASLAVQEEVVSRMRKEMIDIQRLYSQLEKKAKKTQVRSDYEERDKVHSQMQSFTRELGKEEEALKHLRKESDTLAHSQSTLVARMMAVRKAMGDLKIAGGQSSQEYRNLTQEMAILSKAHTELRKEMRLLAKGSASNFTALVEGLQGLVGVVTAAAGAMTFLGSESKEYEEIQAKLQALMAITIGLQQAHNLFTSTSAVRMKLASTATSLYAAAQLKLATALGISAVQAKIAMAALTGGLSILLMGAIIAIDKIVSKMRAQSKELREIREAAAQNVAAQVAQIHKLSEEYKKLGDNAKAKKKWLEDHREEIDKTGYAIRSIDQADKVFISNTQEFIDALTSRAMAAALMDVAAKEYQKAIEKMIEGEQTAKKQAPMAARFFMDEKAQKAYMRSEGDKMIKEGRKMIKDTSKRFSEIISREEETNIFLLSFGVKTIEQETGEERRRREEEEAKRKAQRVVEARMEAENKLLQMSVSTQQQIDAAVIAAMQEGTAKKLEQLKAEHKQKIDAIDAHLREIDELERKHKVDGSKQRKQLSQLKNQEESSYTLRKKEIEEAAARAAQGILEQSSADLKTRHEREISDLDKYYNDLIVQLRKHVTDEQKLKQHVAQLENDRRRRQRLLSHEHELEMLDFETEVARRRAELRVMDISSAAEADEELMRTDLKAAEARLQKLEEIKSAGGEADKDIQLLILQIERLKKELEKMPVRKLREVASGLKGIFSNIAQLGGELGSTFASLADSVDKVFDSIDKKLSTTDKAFSIANGLIGLYSIAEQTAKANAEAEQKWAEAAVEAAHRAAKARLQDLQHKENIFGVENPYARAVAGANQYREAMLLLGKSLEKLQQGEIQVGTKRVLSAENILKGAAMGAAAGASLGPIGAAVGGVLGAIFGATQKKVVPIFRSLTAQFGSILKEGTKSFELNPKIVENYNKLDEATKKLVDNWEDIRNEAMKAEEQMRDTFKALAGDLGAMLSKALSEGFRSNDIDAAMKDFEKSVDKLIENIIEQMVFSALFKDLFDKAEKDMMSSFAPGGDGTIVDDIIFLKKEAVRRRQLYMDEMRKAKQELKEQEGMNLFTDEGERSAVAARGLAQASQDSINELIGIETTILMYVRLAYEMRQAEKTSQIDRDAVLRAMAMNVQVIAENSDFLRKLETIAVDIASLSRDGVTLKK